MLMDDATPEITGSYDLISFSNQVTITKPSVYKGFVYIQFSQIHVDKVT